MVKVSLEKLKEFLRESNAIEGVYDEKSLWQAIYAWEYIIEQTELSPSNICRTHKILMLDQPLLPDEKGYFRKCAVYIGNRQGMNHKEVTKSIKFWCKQMNIWTDDENKAAELSQKLHVKYENIHPFVDGNGRTGRIFMNWFRAQNGLPLLIIKESERQDYYKWFK